jgi:4-alpha-glucanotransferase
MTSDSGLPVPPFPSSYRDCGLLLHATSLPTPYGVGDVGPAAIAWIDQLSGAGQSWWQALPLGPTGYGNSPYQSLSSFAANGLLISPDCLIDDGLLRPSECATPSFSPSTVDYKAVIPFKHGLLKKAWNIFRTRRPTELHVPLQDVVNLGAEGRMNVPGRVEGNWSWCCTEQMLGAANFQSLRELTATSNRLPILQNAMAETMEAVL